MFLVLIHIHISYRLFTETATSQSNMKFILATPFLFLLSCEQTVGNERSVTRAVLEDYVVSARPVKNVSTFDAILS